MRLEPLEIVDDEGVDDLREALEAYDGMPASAPHTDRLEAWTRVVVVCKEIAARHLHGGIT